MLMNTLKHPTDPVNAYFLTTFSASTIESSTYRMRQFCAFTFNNKVFETCDWSKISYTKVLEFIHFLKNNGQSFTSINTTLAVIKSVSLHCWQLDYINCDTYMRIKSLKKIKGRNTVAGRTLTSNEINTINNYYKQNISPLDCRDYAIFALGIGAGLRRNEIRMLDFESIDNEKITVTGKNNHTRSLPLTRFVSDALNNWLSFRDCKSGAIFTKTYKNSVKERLTILSIHRTAARISKNTNLTPFTSHDLRRTFATLLLDNDADRFGVQRLLGHSNLKTIDIYDRRPDRHAKATIQLLPF
ncbi:tyrosine-type recombinase/integrase [Thalassotalea profundi]|uniref:Integrase n=1 Tax=Thalassotalea profundi TaxID=2036687 RepID=A0ABQ3IPW5_9GAMM|nr:site-specific integrase [Thalassotalea profundi]GHE87535.1 integrase [Thalassotalea profundi]